MSPNLRSLTLSHTLPVWAKCAALAAAAAAAAVVMSLGGGSGARAASDRPVAGTIVSRQVTGPDCTSPVGLCTTGEFRGAITGTFAFTATALIASVDTPTTGVVFYTGDLALRTKDGELTIKDAGAFNTGLTGEVASVSTIIGGTAQLAGASGALRITGIFQSGCVACEYEGRLRLP